MELRFVKLEMEAMLLQRWPVLGSSNFTSALYCEVSVALVRKVSEGSANNKNLQISKKTSKVKTAARCKKHVQNY